MTERAVASVLGLAVLVGVLLTACLRLPEAAPQTAPDATDEASLRELTEFVNLGTCTEGGWDGEVRTEATEPLEATIGVIFQGFGAEPLGRGTTTVAVEAGSTRPFSVVPDPPIEDLVLSCSIELATIQIRN
ncbi:MAG: hypothetical protein OXH20_04505 [bacterium]|nr:hypothetical protein [bacterium]MXZ30776.1 hypothetical protein [Acidimicrobiia bacterium]MDE0669833.1 hypothetical protein [bacterium]MYB25019.1 hypothetical protein [Acidimicrobiia bacterium]MYE67607.1 hypothetical protein [Acidimicrobiia bacterium]